jgi:hypothetical protein
VRISDALPRITVGLRRARSPATPVRYGVAPAPTGSSTHGVPSATARSTAISIASTHGGDSVPMLITSAREMPAKSAASSRACTIAGEAPMASSALAVTSIAT